MAELPPGLLLILGSLVVPLLGRRLRALYMLALPLVGLWALIQIEPGIHHAFNLFGYGLEPVRVDRLSVVFGIIFYIAAFLSIVYALHLRDTTEQVCSLLYAGSAIGAVFAGDFLTLFVYWEGTAVASVFLIWARRTERSYAAGMRYLLIQVGSGVLLLSGALLHVQQTGQIVFDRMQLDGPAAWLIFLAFGIKCAFPFLHNWLQDAYPEATVSGTVFLSAFTTKLAVYALARGFPGTELLILIGATMTVFPIFYAEIENDFRRVLAYSLNNQLGFMVTGIGIGTEMALNGAVAHAFAHILYKALLFMSMGAVLYRTGTIKGTDMGGLYKSMPWTAAFCIVGAASISAFPLFSGFVSKSLVLEAAAAEGHWIAWLALVLASAGVLFHAGIKVPFFCFFGHDSGLRCREAPWHMLAAMAATAALCVLIGVYPDPLYAILPYAVAFEPYTAEHVVTQLQLLLFSVLAFAVLLRAGVYPLEKRLINLDFDWVYRRAAPIAVRWIAQGFALVDNSARLRALVQLERLVERVIHYHGPHGVLARTAQTGATAFWVAVVLVVYLLVYYL